MKQIKNQKNLNTLGLKQSIPLGLMALSGLLLFPNSSEAQNYQLKQTLSSSQLASLFGFAVAINEQGQFVISEPSNSVFNSPPNISSSVNTYGADGQLDAVLNDPTSSQFFNNRYGYAVATSGQNILVGAPGNNSINDTGGRGYLYQNGSTTISQTYVSPNSQAQGEFAFAVDVSGNNVILGAPGENNGAGNAYIGTISNTNIQALNIPGGNAGQFGFSVAANNNNFIVGAPSFQGTGAAFQFQGTNFIRSFLGTEVGSLFGFDVDINDTTIAISAPNLTSTSNALRNGGVFLYDVNNGNPIGNPIRNPETTTSNGLFGASIAFTGNGNDIIIGAPGNTSSVGAVYRYKVSDQQWFIIHCVRVVNCFFLEDSFPIFPHHLHDFFINDVTLVTLFNQSILNNLSLFQKIFNVTTIPSYPS